MSFNIWQYSFTKEYLAFYDTYIIALLSYLMNIFSFSIINSWQTSLNTLLN